MKTYIRLTISKVHCIGPSFWAARQNYLNRHNPANCDDDETITDDEESGHGDRLDEDINTIPHLKKRTNIAGTSITSILGLPTSNAYSFHFKLSLSVGFVILAKEGIIVADKLGIAKVRAPVL